MRYFTSIMVRQTGINPISIFIGVKMKTLICFSGDYISDEEKTQCDLIVSKVAEGQFYVRKDACGVNDIIITSDVLFTKIKKMTYIIHKLPEQHTTLDY